MSSDDDEAKANYWIYKQFRESLQALSMPADVQIALFPAGANVCSELLMDVIASADSYVSIEQDTISAKLRNDIENTKSLVRDLYEIRIDNRWDTNCLYDDKEWQQVRETAMELLTSLGWPLERPMRR